jgi:uncharacterized damage-inducible protein DinB
MTSPLDELHELYAFNRWANARILDAVAALPDDAYTRDLGSSFPSVQDTLVHILAAEWIWLSRWRGSSPGAMPAAWRAATPAEVRRHLDEVEAGQRAFLEGLDEADLDRTVEYASLAGDALASRVREMLRHVVNHSTYHRGQIATMLRQLGAKPPSTDLILFFRTAGAREVAG